MSSSKTSNTYNRQNWEDSVGFCLVFSNDGFVFTYSFYANVLSLFVWFSIISSLCETSLC